MWASVFSISLFNSQGIPYYLWHHMQPWTKWVCPSDPVLYLYTWYWLQTIPRVGVDSGGRKPGLSNLPNPRQYPKAVGTGPMVMVNPVSWD